MAQCKRLKDSENVNKRLVDFDNLTDSCLNHGLNVSLPLTFQLLVSKKTDRHDRLLGDKSLGDKRKSKTKQGVLGMLLTQIRMQILR